MNIQTTKVELFDGDYLEFSKILSEDGTVCFGKMWQEYDSNGNIVLKDCASNVHERYLYENNRLKKTYNPAKRGAVVAIRIFFDEARQSKAELKFAFDEETEIIDWTNTRERKMYDIGINGYTHIFDERHPNETFDSFFH